MLTPEIKKKLIIFFAIPAFIIVALFLVFGIFLNYGTIIIAAKPGYEVSFSSTITNLCALPVCSFKVQPGKYTLTINKPNFQKWVGEVKVGYLETTKLTANLIYQPQIKEINPSQLPAAPFSRIQNPHVAIFIDEIGQNGMYLSNDTKTGSQILMVGALDQVAGRTKLLKNPDDTSAILNPVAVTSFIREVKLSQFTSNDASKSIIMVDETGPGTSKIYFIDRTSQSRNYIGEMDSVTDIRLLPNDQLLIWGKHDGKFDSVLLLDPKTQKFTDLHLNTSLNNVVFINENRLIAGTDQALQDMSAPENYEGHTIELGDPQDGYVFIVDYSLDQPEPHLIKAIKNDGKLNGMFMNEAKNTLYFALGVNGQAYQLQFDDDAPQSN